MILFSIIMPVFNAESTLEYSINSVIKQSYSNWELVAVNDGSTDGTLGILNSFSQKDSRIKVFSQKNSGPGVARNTAIKNARGDYVAFLDSDDYWSEDFLELINEKIANEKADEIFYDIVIEKTNGTAASYRNNHVWSDENQNLLIRKQMTGVLPWGMTKAIKRQIIEDGNFRFSSLSVGEEAIFSFDVLRSASVIRFVDKPIYHCINRGTGQHKKGNEDPWRLVVSNLKEHLIALNQLDLYEKTINSFAFRALSIALYRISSAENERWKLKKRRMKSMLKEYSQQYDLNNLDMDALDRNSWILIPIIRCKMLFLVYFLSALRKKNKK